MPVLFCVKVVSLGRRFVKNGFEPQRAWDWAAAVDTLWRRVTEFAKKKPITAPCVIEKLNLPGSRRRINLATVWFIRTSTG